MKKTKKPREWWAIMDDTEPRESAVWLYAKKEDAEADQFPHEEVVLIREVLPKKPKKG